MGGETWKSDLPLGKEVEVAQDRGSVAAEAGAFAVSMTHVGMAPEGIASEGTVLGDMAPDGCYRTVVSRFLIEGPRKRV